MDDNIDFQQECCILSIGLRAELLKLANCLRIFEDNVKMLQSSQTVYWNGVDAYNYLRSSLGFVAHNKVLYKNLSKCSRHIDKIANLDDNLI